MSIYCSLFEVGGEHKDTCKRIKKVGRGEYEQDNTKPCTCGSYPIIYQGSHILPRDTDRRGGEIGISAIPGHIHNRGRKHILDDNWYPWLRIHADDTAESVTLVLTKKQVEAFRDALNKWLERT